jgi:hypothetical protein
LFCDGTLLGNSVNSDRCPASPDPTALASTVARNAGEPGNAGEDTNEKYRSCNADVEVLPSN